MSEQEAIVCPFCGAPYTGEIPHNVVHVKCMYCGGVILLPSHLSVIPRCPNHPDTIAVGLCSRCFQGFCKQCLHLREVEEVEPIFVQHVWRVVELTQGGVQLELV